MHVRDIRRTDNVQLGLLKLLPKVLGDQVLEDLLPDITRKLFADETGRRMTRPEPGKFRALLKGTDDAFGLGVHGFHRDRDFERMPATFYYCQWGFTSVE